MHALGHSAADLPDLLHQRVRPAAVELLAVAQRGDQLVHREVLAVALVVEVVVHAFGIQRLQLLVEGRPAAIACGVHQAPVLAVTHAPANHRQDRRDADAASDEAVAFGILVEWEVVAWPHHLEAVALAQRAVDVPCAAAAVGGKANGDHVALPLAVVVEQGVVADQPVAQVQLQMRAGGEGRQFAAAGIDQLQGDHILGFGHDAADLQGQGCVRKAHCCSTCMAGRARFFGSLLGRRACGCRLSAFARPGCHPRGGQPGWRAPPGRGRMVADKNND
ncbi:hypothetical protein D3C84_630040 [compost metagenome]